MNHARIESFKVGFERIKSTISLVYFPIVLVLYCWGILIEERILIEEYGDEYMDYKKKVPKRLIPFVI